MWNSGTFIKTHYILKNKNTPYKLHIKNYKMKPHLSSKKSIREQWDLADELQVGQDADDRPEQCLHRLRQLRAPRVPRVHGDEDTHFAVHRYFLTFKL